MKLSDWLAPSRRAAATLGIAVVGSGSLSQAQTAPAPAEEPDTNPPAVTTAPTVEPPTTSATVPTPQVPEAAPPIGTADVASELPAGTPASPESSAENDALAAIQAELSAASVAAVDDFALNLYGFADFGYQMNLTESVLTSDSPSFAVGKLNLYAAADLGQNWRSLVEIRFMYSPNGDTATTPNATRTDTTVADPTDFSRPVRWGGISIERAWLEYTIHPLLTVRAGQWLTPYGIWNVDHGSPVIIGVRRPFVVGEALLPERQTGLEIYGSAGFGPSQLGYHLTVSNGRGPVDTYQDYDDNKALGGRLFFKTDSEFGTLTLGASGYLGKYTDGVRRFELDDEGLRDPTVVGEQFDELSLAADLKWEWGGFLLQSEVIANERSYTEGHRPTAVLLTGAPPGFVPDHRKFGIYGLAGYRTPWVGIMPFAGAEYYDPGVRIYSGRAYGIWAGINLRPTPRVVLKAQYTHGWFPQDDFEPINILDFQAAWSF